MNNSKKVAFKKYLIWPGPSFFMVVVLIQSLLGTDHTRPVMEPYALSGNRMIFSNWFYIRPGHFDWLDKNGKSVYAKSDAKLDDKSAQFVYFDSPYGIRLFAEKAQHEIPVIDRDKPWDKWGIRLSTLILENGKYRLWGTCNSDYKTQRNCYFESQDGFTWDKPELGLVTFQEHKNTNLLNTKVGLSVFIDPVAPSGERYKTAWHSRIGQEEFEKFRDSRPWSYYALELDAPLVHVIKAAVSPDGFNWEELDDPIAFEHGDTQNIGYFDTNLNKYVLYIRTHMVGSRAEGQPYPKEKFHQRISRRAIGRMVSTDFKEFPFSELIIETESDMHPSDQFYTNCRTTLPGSPDHHIMFPALYNVAHDETTILLYSSYDGITWHRVPGGTVFETQNFGEPDGGCVFTHPNLVERSNGDWILPYDGYNVPHKYPRGAYRFEPGMLVWPKGRLVGVEAAEEGGFATVAFIPPGPNLRINALTRRAGHIQVEVLNMQGEVVRGRSFAECLPIVGNHHWTLVSWGSKNTIGIPPGDPVILRFKLKFAKIYGLEFK